MQTDVQLLALLSRDPEAGMAAIMERYSGLVWAVAAQHLTAEEDVRECVNETFAAFYFQRDRYDPEKGPLGAWLARIAQRRAVDKWRAGQRAAAEPLPPDLAAPEGLSAEDRLDLARALDRLSPEEARLLRLKYFAGLSAKEIAAALDLPYETVKKRQQRGLARLRRMLLAGLVLVLLALLAACGYLLLRYFGVLPGYGINTSAESPFAILAADALAESDTGTVTVTDALWNGDTLLVTLQLEKGPAARDETITAGDGSQVTLSWDSFLLADVSLVLGDASYRPALTVTDAARSTADTRVLQLQFAGLAPPAEETVPAVLDLAWLEVPFTLAPARETSPDAYSYALGDCGGVLAIPAPAADGFVLELYPMDTDDFAVSPGIVLGQYPAAGRTGALTLTDGAGQVYEGAPVGYNPYSTALYSRWDFGPLAPGTYTLHIPYLLVSAALPAELSLPVADGAETAFDVPGARLTARVQAAAPADAAAAGDGTLPFFVTFDAQPLRPDLVLAGLTLSPQCDAAAPADWQGGWMGCRLCTDDTGAFAGLEAAFAPQALEASPRLVAGPWGTVGFIWTQSFDLTITVP